MSSSLTISIAANMLQCSSICFNSLGIYLLKKKDPVWTRNGMILANLSISEIINAILLLGFSVLLRIKKDNKLMNHAFHGLTDLTVFMNMKWYFAMYVMIIDRYLACKYPLRHRILVTKRRIFILCVSLWLLVTFAWIIAKVGTSVQLTFRTHSIIWFILDGIFMLLFLLTYGTIFHRIIKSKRLQTQSSNSSQQSNYPNRATGNKAFYGVVGLIALTFCVFVIIPHLILLLGSTNIGITMYSVGFLVDPIIYIFMRKDLRSELKKMFRCCN